MNNPETISTSVNQTGDHIYQDIIEFSSKEDRKSQLINLLEKREDFDKVIVFGETKFGVQRLSDELEKWYFVSRNPW